MKKINVKAGQIYSAVNKEVIVLIKPQGKKHYDRATLCFDPTSKPLGKKATENWLKSGGYELTGFLKEIKQCGL